MYSLWLEALVLNTVIKPVLEAVPARSLDLEVADKGNNTRPHSKVY